MHKIIYKIEFDPIKTTDNLFCHERTVGEEYETADGQIKQVISLEENFEFGLFSVIICYEDGYEDRAFDLHHIHKKIVLD